MDEQQHSLDEIFRQSLGDYREAPPAAAWEKVVEKLDADDKEKRKGFVWPWPWIVLLLLLTIGGGIFLAARFQDGQPKQEQAEEFSTAGSSANQNSTSDAPGADNASNENKVTAEAAQKSPVASNDKSLSNTAKTQNPVSNGTTAVSSDKPVERKHSIVDHSTTSNHSDKTSNHSEKKSKSHSNKNNGDEMWASSDDENAYRSKSALPKKASSDNEVNVENDAANMNDASGQNSTTQKKTNTSKTSKTNESADGLNQEPAAGNSNSTGTAAKSSKSKSTGSSSNGNSVAVSSGDAQSGNAVATPSGKVATSNKPLKVKSSSKNQTTKKTSTSSNETAKSSVSGKTGSKSTQKKSPSETTASPDATKTVAAKPTADATSAASSSAGAGSVKAPALAKAEPEKIPTQRKPGTAMAATSPGFEESKAKGEVTLPVPAAAPKNESVPSKDTSKAAVATTTEPETDSKGGEGGSTGDGKSRQKPSFSLALHGGYEFAMQNPAPNMFSAGFRFLWHFNPGISLGIQPSIRYGNMSTISSESQAYQQTSDVKVDSLIGTDSAGKVTSRTYHVSQTFDSIVVAGLSAGGVMWQFEIPIILNYKLGGGWFAYGGPSINIGGKMDHSSGNTKTYSFRRGDTLFSPSGSVQPPKPPSSFANYFGTSSLPQYSTYTPAASEWKDPMNLRFGYLVGLGYEHNRLSFDVSLHQQVSGFSDVIEPYKKAYSSPYIRIGVGWKIIPEKKK
jgi:hypothetical protein